MKLMLCVENAWILTLSEWAVYATVEILMFIMAAMEPQITIKWFVEMEGGLQKKLVVS